MHIDYDRVSRLIANGATRKELREKLSMQEHTYMKLMKEDPAFREAVNLGDVLYSEDLETVLYETARGYEHTEIETVTEVDDLGKERTKYRETTKHYKPDVSALKLALTNRNPDRWKDRQNIDIDTTAAVTIINDLPKIES